MDLHLMKKKLLNYIKSWQKGENKSERNSEKYSVPGLSMKDYGGMNYTLRLRLLNSILTQDNTLQNDSRNLEVGNRETSLHQVKLKLMRVFSKS
jgi:hypothetical protein